MQFLTARWQHLLFANYAIDPAVLQEFVPAGTSVDCFEGETFVSLVAFLFADTRLVGVPIPWHRRFEEVNLRFYVVPERDPTIRGVTFLQEIVPKATIPLIANSLFDENYVALPMQHDFDGKKIEYKWGKQLQHRFAGTIEQRLHHPAPGSLGEFITEHYWGYAQGTRRTLEYKVTHPPWQSCELSSYEIDVDFEETYGAQFEFLNHQQPDNVQYALGSEVGVSFPNRLNVATKGKEVDGRS